MRQDFCDAPVDGEPGTLRRHVYETAVGAPLEGRTERSEATEISVPAFFSETYRPLRRLIILQMISAFISGSPLMRGVIRYAPPSGRTELRVLLRYAPFLQRLSLIDWEHNPHTKKPPLAARLLC